MNTFNSLSVRAFLVELIDQKGMGCSSVLYLISWLGKEIHKFIEGRSSVHHSIPSVINTISYIQYMLCWIKFRATKSGDGEEPASCHDLDAKEKDKAVLWWDYHRSPQSNTILSSISSLAASTDIVSLLKVKVKYISNLCISYMEKNGPNDL